jgi:hypothetical protein
LEPSTTNKELVLREIIRFNTIARDLAVAR